MSKYKTGDKIVMEIGKEIEIFGKKGNDVINDEPLSAYTEPLEAKIRRQAAEITRLLAENERLKKENEELNLKVDYYESYSDKHEEECEQEFNRGCNEAWELARKIMLYGEDTYSGKELKEIFDCTHTQEIIRNHTYPEAAAKVAEWKKAKEEIKVGDVLENIYDSNIKCIVTNLYTNNKAYLVFDDGTAGMNELDNFKKTGRHINIDRFFKADKR